MSMHAFSCSHYLPNSACWRKDAVFAITKDPYLSKKIIIYEILNINY